MNFLSKHKTLVIFVICALLLAAAREARLADYPLMQAVRNLTFDSFQRLKPRAPTAFPIRIVDVDEASILANGQWPWPRTRLATLVEKVTAAGAAVIAFDMVFSEPDRTSPKAVLEGLSLDDADTVQALGAMLSKLPDNDDVFAQKLAKTTAVMAFFGVDGPSVNALQPKAAYSYLGVDPAEALPSLEGSIGNLEALQRPASGIGAATLNQTTRDDVIRAVPMFFKVGSDTYPNLGLEALRVALQADTFLLKTTEASGEIGLGKVALTHAKMGDLVFPLTADGKLQMYFSPHDPERLVSAQSVFSEPVEALREKFEGHIVFVGASATGLEDIRTNALGETVPGVSIHAQIADQILSNTFLNRPDWARGAEIMMMIVTTGIIVLVLPFAGAVISGVVGGLVAVLTFLTCWLSFSWYGLLIDPVFPMLTGAAIFLIATLLMYALTEREKKFVRSAFQQYLAPDLLKRLEQNPELLRLGGEIRHMTIMFMDIRGFTPISEKLTPEELVTFLNTLLSPLTDVILKYEGAIDKYIGDSIMAFWNAPLDVDDHATKACQAALEMLETTARMNAEDAFGFGKGGKDLGEVQIGIGISTGRGCVGNMGSKQRFDYSVVGDTVNIASRVESSCKAVGWPILLSQSTAEESKNLALLEAGEISLKGKSLPEPLFALIGDQEMSKSDHYRTLRHHHMKVVDALNDATQRDALEDIKKTYLEIAGNRYRDFISKLGHN